MHQAHHIMGSSSSLGATGGGSLGKASTAKQVMDHYAQGSPRFLLGKCAVVTGGNAGIGLETCKALAHSGCRVIMASRDVGKGQKAVDSEIASPGLGGYVVADTKTLVTVAPLDLENLDSIRAFAELVAKEPRVDFLILNAGIMAVEKLEYTTQGFEKQIGTNHYGNFYLTSLLRDKLVAQPFESRVVALSSIAHKQAVTPPDWSDLHFKTTKYTPWGSYGNSKLANILFAKELADQTASSNVGAFSVHPGVIMTGLYKHVSSVLNFVISLFIADKSIPQGAATTLYACLEPSLKSAELRGSYLVDCAVASPSEAGQDVSKLSRKALWRRTDEDLAAALSK